MSKTEELINVQELIGELAMGCYARGRHDGAKTGDPSFSTEEAMEAYNEIRNALLGPDPSASTETPSK